MLVYMVTRKTLIQKIGYNMATTFGEYQANLFASSLFGPQQNALYDQISIGDLEWKGGSVLVEISTNKRNNIER